MDHTSKLEVPKEEAALYMCRKQFHAIHLQVVCNAKSVFSHCYTENIGSVHARVFRNSTFAHYIGVPNEYFSFDIYSRCCICNAYVMVLFRDNGLLIVLNKNYDFCLSIRTAIE